MTGCLFSTTPSRLGLHAFSYSRTHVENIAVLIAQCTPLRHLFIVLKRFSETTKASSCTSPEPTRTHDSQHASIHAYSVLPAGGQHQDCWYASLRVAWGAHRLSTLVVEASVLLEVTLWQFDAQRPGSKPGCDRPPISPSETKLCLAIARAFLWVVHRAST